MRAAMEHLLYAAKVDIAFAGHVHAYERFVSTLKFAWPCLTSFYISNAGPSSLFNV
jgi:hypothetical protein